ncbi:MAG: hypothetical protein RXN86_03910 [Vulcanisaeta sp.]
MAETNKIVLIIVAVVVVIIVILAYLILTKKLPTSITSSTPSSSTIVPPPSSSVSTATSSSVSPPSSSSPIQVTSFVIPSGCNDAYCWARVTFNSSITGTLTTVYTVYSNGTKYCWGGNYQVTQGTNTIWLDDFLPCYHLSCNPPGQITALIFVINGNQYTVPVTPTTGNPLSPGPTSNSQKFIGGYNPYP